MKSVSDIVDQVLFVSLLAIIPIVVIPYGTVDAWWEAIFECLVFFLTAIWILKATFASGWQLRKLSLVFPLIVLTAYAFLQAIQWPSTSGTAAPRMLSVDHYQTYLTARKLLALTLFLAALLTHTSTAKRFRWCVKTIIAVGLGSALFGILRQFLQSPESNQGFILSFLFYGIGYGQFISPNAFAYVMELTLGLLLGLILGGGVRRNRVLIYAAILAVVWTALVLSNSRGGLLSLGGQVVFVLLVSLNWYLDRKLSSGEEAQRWMIFLRQSKLVRALGIIFVLGGLTAGVFWIGGINLANKMAGDTEVEQAGPDGSTRQEIWRASGRMFRNNLWTGVGFGAYYLAIPQYQVGSGRLKLEQAHNDYLDLAASGGIIGLVLSAWFVTILIGRARASFKQHDGYQRAAALGAVTGMLGVGIHSFVDFGLQVTAVAIMFATLVVIVVADVRTESSRLLSHRVARKR